MKEFSKFEIATIKRTAQSVASMVIKKNKIKAQLDELQAEYDTLNTMQEQYEAPIKTMTGGYGTEDLVERVVENTGKVDKDGKPIKVTKYVLKYPDTIVPPTETPVIMEPVDDNPTIGTTIEGIEHGSDPSDLPFMN